MPTPTLEDAIALAARLHAGQVDKAGEKYILHPLRVMLSPRLTSDQERILAVLHDVVEDCDISLVALGELGYIPEVVDGLRFLTKEPQEEHDYETFIARVCTGPAAVRRVKLADLDDNANLSRISKPNEWDLKRKQKYDRAIATIEGTF